MDWHRIDSQGIEKQKNSMGPSCNAKELHGIDTPGTVLQWNSSDWNCNGEVQRRSAKYLLKQTNYIFK